ncbi:hypothetical protein B0T09DRAFT_338875 [Sordaria sp. MPI-SDFR-AT-0083]|nr:hypothetical protein B0T09DRAFT_338875 [Sordaria sp. MPI-SDFR-AT-0083]
MCFVCVLFLSVQYISSRRSGKGCDLLAPFDNQHQKRYRYDDGSTWQVKSEGVVTSVLAMNPFGLMRYLPRANCVMAAAHVLRVGRH